MFGSKSTNKELRCYRCRAANNPVNKHDEASDKTGFYSTTYSIRTDATRTARVVPYQSKQNLKLLQEHTFVLSLH